MKYSDEWFYENGYFKLQNNDVNRNEKPTTMATKKFRDMLKHLLIKNSGKIITPEEVEDYLDGITSIK